MFAACVCYSFRVFGSYDPVELCLSELRVMCKCHCRIRAGLRSHAFFSPDVFCVRSCVRNFCHVLRVWSSCAVLYAAVLSYLMLATRKIGNLM